MQWNGKAPTMSEDMLFKTSFTLHSSLNMWLSVERPECNGQICPSSACLHRKQRRKCLLCERLGYGFDVEIASSFSISAVF